MSQFQLHNQAASLAKETLATSEKTGDRTLKIMGLAALILTSAAGLVHGVRQFCKDIVGSRGGYGNGNGQGVASEASSSPEPRASGHQQPWAGRRELSSRRPEANHAQAATHRSRSAGTTGQER